MQMLRFTMQNQKVETASPLPAIAMAAHQNHYYKLRYIIGTKNMAKPAILVAHKVR
jgi:hypothetical protein